ncbi:ABC transporter ATP-binding protein [Pseudonocardia bannensis]|uniref:ABC-type quaternary amine transporter n=1 Tax=Pseudonocardia bannensis TaxID=630973 RepID=A0A848DCU3_9PSEU|nr:ABC transporter ATP-binding protein [Pseudonocardia bannensis]NMH90416.1 ABC transporter ATP-binding protein [Pseudonocardia bannensis]
MTEIRDRVRAAGKDENVAGGLRVAGVSKSYGAVPVLRGVDLDVEEGSLTAVLGRSGCGKTTLLRLIAGFDRPDAGTIHLAGRPVAGPGLVLAPEERRIGYVTQEGNLFPHLTVAANIAFGLPRRARRARHRVSALLEMVGLDGGYARRYPHELSGGQQQRVALARALAPEPGIVLLDEPFAALDVELRESTRRAVVDVLAAAGATTVLVTHDQAEALSLASRVAVMRDGAVVQVASPAELYRNPVDRAVAAFVGDVVALPATLRGGIAECALGGLPIAGDGGAGDGPVTVLVRPEQIALDGDDGDVPAQVLEIEYYGHDAVVRLGLGGAVTVRARCPGYALPAVGSHVRLVVRGEVGVDRS